MRALKFLFMKNNIEVLYKLLKSAILVPGQLRNLPVKIGQIALLILSKCWVKLNFFFEKTLISYMIYTFKIITFYQNDPRDI